MLNTLLLKNKKVQSRFLSGKKSILIAGSLFLLVLIYSSCNNQEKKENATEEQTTNEEATYVCPMHPEVTSDKPGQCSKCGMDLEKVENHKEAEHNDSTGHENHDH